MTDCFFIRSNYSCPMMYPGPTWLIDILIVKRVTMYRRPITCWSIVLMCLLGGVSLSAAQMKTGEKMKDYQSVFPLDNSQKNFKVILTDTNAPGCLFTPDDQPHLTFQIQNLTDEPIQTTGHVRVSAFGTRGIPGDTWLPEVFKIADVQTLPIDVNVKAKGWMNVTVDLKLPARLGGYAAIVDMGDLGSQKLATMVRTFKHDVEHIQFPKQSMENLDPAILARMGIRAVRYGVNYVNSTHSSYDDYLQKLDADFSRMKQYGVTATVEIGAGQYDMPMGRPRPHLDDKGNMIKGKMDHVWLPSNDDDYQAYCQLITEKYGWPKGPVIGMMLWNEPWEGKSISGWQADMIRYRTLYKRMGIAVHQGNDKANVKVLVGGCDSSSNTWDKLFADGTDEFLPYLDFCSIHYQGMTSPALFSKWVNRKDGNGRVLIWDTESWVANTDDRFAGVVATNRAAGYDRSMGVFGGNISTWGHHHGQPKDKVFNDAGKLQRVEIPVQTWPLAASVSAVQHFLGQREFDRILIQHSLPWVYVFEGLNQNPDDGTVVVVGDIGALFGAEKLLYRTVRSLDEVNAILNGQKTDDAPMPFSGASMTLPADPDYSLYDFYGNVVKANEQDKIVIPLDDRGFFLRADKSKAGSFNRMLDAITKARIDGIEPLEIIPQDMLQTVSSSANLPVKICNMLNRPVQGKLNVSLAGVTICDQSISLNAYGTRIMHLNLASLQPNSENTYAFKAVFDGGSDGKAEHHETLHVNIIAQRKITVDGKLDDWQNVLPQTITATGTQSLTLTEAAWLPFEKFDAGQSGGVATAWLAYDKDYFYFAAKVADDSVDPGMLRFANRDHDADFYPQTASEVDSKSGNQKTYTWPEGVRRFSYRRRPALPAGDAPNHDNILIAFNAIELADESDWITHLPGRMPGFVAYKDTDYEYALNTVAPPYGGGFEVWRMLAPGMIRKHFYPRQPSQPQDGPVTDARLITVHQDNTRITELAMPWSELPDIRARLDAGDPVKFSFKVHNNTGGPDLELATDRGVSRINPYAFHSDWKQSWANEVQFIFER